MMALMIIMTVNPDFHDEDEDEDEDDGYHVMKVIQSWKLSSDESYNSQRSDDLWRIACGDVFFWAWSQTDVW